MYVCVPSRPVSLHPGLVGKKEKMFMLALHTSFLHRPVYTFSKKGLDKVCVYYVRACVLVCGFCCGSTRM